VHESALEATCVLIGARQRFRGAGSDPKRLHRLAVLAGQARRLAVQLAAVHEQAAGERAVG
jgi:hypothetical protein